MIVLTTVTTVVAVFIGYVLGIRHARRVVHDALGQAKGSRVRTFRQRALPNEAMVRVIGLETSEDNPRPLTIGPSTKLDHVTLEVSAPGNRPTLHNLRPGDTLSLEMAGPVQTA